MRRRRRGSGGLRPPLPAFSHTHTHRDRAKEAPAGSPATSRRRPIVPHLGCRINLSQRERESGSGLATAKAVVSKAGGLDSGGQARAQVDGKVPVGLILVVSKALCEPRARELGFRASRGLNSTTKSNPNTGPLAWIRGGFPHPPIYG